MQVRLRTGVFALAVALCAGLNAQAAPLITEIYFNPPGNNDVTGSLEYIELHGQANMSLDNYYFIVLENENDVFNSQNPGEIENVFNLSGMSFGSNGYLVLGMRNTPYPALSGAFDIPDASVVNLAAPTKAESLKTLANGTHAYINRDTGNGFGNGVTSSIGHTGQNADLEGSGFTAMLIKVDPGAGGLPPVVNDDLDVDNFGLDMSTGKVGWTILDSIGVFGELGEAEYGRLYASVNFGPGTALGPPGGVPAGAAYVDTSPAVNELEYVGRVGVGHTAADWMAANLTNDGQSGYSDTLRNYAISGNHTAHMNPEVYVGSVLGPSPFEYGTDITVTFGADNVGSVHIPEPTSVTLLGIGLAGLTFVRLRNRKRS